MRFGIDLDGVLAEFGGRVVEIGNARWPGKFPPDYRPDNWNYDGYLSKDEWSQIWAVIKDTPRFWENEGDMPGLDELVQDIKDDDEAFFITARARTIGESPLVQSTKWLWERHLYPRRGYSVVIAVEEAKHKSDLFRALGLKYFLDDYAPTVEQLNQIEGMHAFVLDQPWNRYAAELPRVHSVTEYLSAIRTLDTNK